MKSTVRIREVIGWIPAFARDALEATSTDSKEDEYVPDRVDDGSNSAHEVASDKEDGEFIVDENLVAENNDSDPFNLMGLIEGKKVMDDGHLEAVSDSLEYPPGYGPTQINDQQVQSPAAGPKQVIDQQVRSPAVASMVGPIDEDLVKVSTSQTRCNGGCVRLSADGATSQVRSGFSMIDEMVKTIGVGRAVGFSMQGAEADLQEIISRVGGTSVVS